MPENLTEEYLVRIADLAARNLVVTTREVEALGIPRLYLAQLVAGKGLSREARGVYLYVFVRHSHRLRAAVAWAAAPRAVVCSLSAAFLHGLVAEAPRALWVAVAPGSRPPAMEWAPVEVIRMLAARAEPHVETWPQAHRAPAVRLTNMEKTVVDLLRFRSRVGSERALEALRTYLALHEDRTRLFEVARENRALGPLERYLELAELDALSDGAEGTD